MPDTHGMSFEDYFGAPAGQGTTKVDRGKERQRGGMKERKKESKKLGILHLLFSLLAFLFQPGKAKGAVPDPFGMDPFTADAFKATPKKSGPSKKRREEEEGGGRGRRRKKERKKEREEKKKEKIDGMQE